MVAYCRIGERSAHTWFVLHELLGKDDVKNYDGSWTEWGNLVGRADREGRLGTSVRGPDGAQSESPAGSGRSRPR